MPLGRLLPQELSSRVGASSWIAHPAWSQDSPALQLMPQTFVHERWDESTHQDVKEQLILYAAKDSAPAKGLAVSAEEGSLERKMPSSALSQIFDVGWL
eukprot:g59563.t1